MFQIYSSKDKRLPEPDFHGAALIDDNGREIPITEAMIREACEALEDQWHYPVKSVQVRRISRAMPSQRRVC